MIKYSRNQSNGTNGINNFIEARARERRALWQHYLLLRIFDYSCFKNLNFTKLTAKYIVSIGSLIMLLQYSRLSLMNVISNFSSTQPLQPSQAWNCKISTNSPWFSCWKGNSEAYFNCYNLL